jgi:5,10-methylenetetrahydromethanopterin reductase
MEEAMASSADRLGDVGTYILPGRTVDPVPGIAQAVAAEQIGLGSVWVAERWETKEVAVTLGALTQRTAHVRLVAGMTHFGTRHPIVIAGMAATLQALSGGRFVLGFARSIIALWRGLGIKPPTNESMGEYLKILRALWAGETVTYDGPAGNYPHMRMPETPKVPPPVVLAAVGPKTLAVAGAHFDGVVLHPFLTTDGVRRSIEIVHEAAIKAGRDPKAIRIYSQVVVAPDLTPEEKAVAVDARAVTYFTLPELGRQIAAMNGWDPKPVEALLGDPRAAGIEMQKHSHEEMRKILLEAARTLPREWLETGAAIGSAAQCAARLREYRRAGAHELVLHGTTPDRLGGLANAYRSGR